MAMIRRVNNKEYLEAIKDSLGEKLESELADRITHFYLQTDGSIQVPNNREGDIIIMLAAELQSKGLLGSSKKSGKFTKDAAREKLKNSSSQIEAQLRNIKQAIDVITEE